MLKKPSEVQLPADTGLPETETLIPPDSKVATAAIGTIEIDDECVTPEYDIQNPWNVEVEWQWNGLGDEPTVNQVMVAPIVGNLTDDNGDGRITESDTPDIVVVIFDSMDGPDGDFWDQRVDARLVAMDGKTGEFTGNENKFIGKGHQQ